MEKDCVPLVKGPLSVVFPQFCKKFDIIPGKPGMYVKIRHLSEIMGLKTGSVSDWFIKGVLPSAERRAKLSLLLYLCGYENEERLNFDPLVLTLSDTIATVTGVDGAAEEIGVTTRNILIWLNGVSKPKDMSAVVEFNRKFSDRRMTKIREWKNLLSEHGFLAGTSLSINYIETPTPPSLVKLAQAEKVLAEDKVTIHLLQALWANIHGSGVHQSDARKKSIRQAIGHAEFADLIGDLQKISMAQFNLKQQG